MDCEGLRSEQSIRLDQAGGSLEKFHTQDQDGLGTCYANATSALLQSALPGNPEVSYLQIATLNAEEKISQQRSANRNNKTTNLYAQNISTEKNPNQWDLTLNGGKTCDTFNILKNKQKEDNAAILCPKNKTNLEKLLANGDRRNKTSKTLTESSKYMNLFQEAFEDKPESEQNAFKNNFNELIQNKKIQLKDKICKKINGNGLEPIMQDILDKALTYMPPCMNEEHPEFLKMPSCKMAKIIASQAIKTGLYSYEANHINPAIMNQIQKSLEKPNKEFSLKQMKADIKEAIMSVFKNDAHDPLMANSFTNVINIISEDKLNDLVSEYKEIQTKGFSDKCVNRLLVDYIAKGDFDKDWNQTVQKCENWPLVEQTKSVLLAYDGSGLKDINNVFSFIRSNAGLNYHDAMLDLYANDCLSSAKIHIPENLTCEISRVNPERKNINNAIILKNLKENKAVTLAFCSSVLDDPNVIFETDKCLSHAVFIKGMKCVNGKYKYLIQNSWGKDIKRAKNPAIQTETQTGSYWFDENTLSNSGLSISNLQEEN
jgi:hypothetical protein